MDVSEISSIAIPTGVIFLAALFVAWRFRQNRKCLERWARENGFELLIYEDCFNGHPSEWDPRTGAAYEITVKDSQGRVRSAWVYNGYPFAEACDKFEVAWKEKSSDSDESEDLTARDVPVTYQA